MKTYDLESRLIEFANLIIDVTETLPNTKAGNHLGGQLLRSGTAPALIYGEAQAAESTADFVHKIKLILKELRESHITNKIIQKRNYLEINFIRKVLQENGELVAIFTASASSASKKK